MRFGPVSVTGLGIVSAILVLVLNLAFWLGLIYGGVWILRHLGVL